MKYYKIITVFFFAIAFNFSSSAQLSLLLDVNGDQPSPYLDHTGNNILTQTGMTTVGDTLKFTSGSDFLEIASFVPFYLDSCWVLEVDLKLTNANDPAAILDWRSNSLTGHMQWAYDTVQGVYFSDRLINGLYGSLVADSMLLPSNQWVHLKMEKTIDSLFIYRDGIRTASRYFSGTALSPVSTTTIGYSLDFRYPHATFYMDNVLFYGKNSTTATHQIQWVNAVIKTYPNPTADVVKIELDHTYNLIQLKILDMQGRVVQENNRQQAQCLELDMQTLIAGIYTVQLMLDNKITVLQIIKK